MRLRELDNKLYSGSLTSIQREEKCKSLVGTTIEISGGIGDIGESDIRVYNYQHDYFGAENDYDSEHLFYQLHYDKARFGSQLLALASGDEVEIICKINSITGSYSTHCKFDLLSITKINTAEERRKIKIEAEKKKEGGCFIATACYGNYDAPEVLVLRQLRDEKLLQTFYGKVFVQFYYFVSPFFATLISKSDLLKKLVRQNLLEPIITKIQRQNL